MKRELQLLACVLFATAALAQDGVRQELARQSQETGLALFSTSGRIDPDSRDVASPKTPGLPSPDGAVVGFTVPLRSYPSHLAIGRLDGAVLQEFPNVANPDVMCFSRDGTRLVTDASYEQKAQLVLVDLNTRAVHPLSEHAYVTSQCWSSDGSEFVYWGQNGVRIYNVARSASRELVNGYFPSWSPDGKWIGFLDRDQLFGIAPDGTGRHLLFKPADKPHSGVWWSPDGRFVAYSQRGTAHPCPWWKICITKYNGPYELRARRLADNADDWLLDEGDTPVTPNYQWVLPKRQNR